MVYKMRIPTSVKAEQAPVVTVWDVQRLLHVQSFPPAAVVDCQRLNLPAAH